jgi:5-methylcytosine-specific restriction endonuclease McrA
MARRRLTVCTQPGCPTLVESGRCAEHAEQPWATSNRRNELPSDWKRRRRRILRRDSYTCVRCGAPAAEVDHIADPHDHNDSNLQSLCSSCHRAKTLAEAAAGRQRRR